MIRSTFGLWNDMVNRHALGFEVISASIADSALLAVKIFHVIYYDEREYLLNVVLPQ